MSILNGFSIENSKDSIENIFKHTLANIKY